MKEAREHLFSRTLKVSETVPASYPAQLQGLEEVTIVVASHRHRRENVSIRGFMRLGLCARLSVGLAVAKTQKNALPSRSSHIGSIKGRNI